MLALAINDVDCVAGGFSWGGTLEIVGGALGVIGGGLMCAAGIAECIDAPLLYAFEHLPQGPEWEDVKRLIGHANGDTPEDIRDRPILLLHAVYGFRVSEVRQLRLEDIDWQNELIRLWRPKHGKTQEYPLTQDVGDAMLST